MKNNKEGRKLSQAILKDYGFVYEVAVDYDGDENHWWIKNGISIHEDSWWIKEGKSCYKKGEKTPKPKFAFATYIKSDGSFKGGFCIDTDTQLQNLYYALSSTKLTSIKKK